MEKGKSNPSGLPSSIPDPSSVPHPDPTPKISSSRSSSSESPRFPSKRLKPPRLVSLCVAVIGKHLEDIADDLGDIAINFPPDVKLTLVAIARRRKLLDDSVITALADSSWEILDFSGSSVSDTGLMRVARTCKCLWAVDISRCESITALGVAELVQHCPLLETLRCGGSPRSDHTARCCLGMLKPKLNDVANDSWEDIDATEIIHGAPSLRWLIWPKIDDASRESLSAECPRIAVNPRPSSPLSFTGYKVPREAFPDIILDDPFVFDVVPDTWGTSGSKPRAVLRPPSSASPHELSMAEKFRLAFLERDSRLAPKRAKNARQHQRRAEKEMMSADTRAKAIALASRVSRSLQGKH
ncbi:hypothetical protein MLD38_034230 [Melastoma candidum]|uniref:Uncharacterized protein n=1 Tax=Melastoma candidum TaxID=119954 RepID=A0ACB9M9E2_9MYRT|nr:hypothetical protein MLD38_034230 [Melastoma candidum]